MEWSIKQDRNIQGGGRLDEIDLLKGISIVLVVVGHTFTSFNNFIYLFHIAVFLMASGYCWRNKVSNFEAMLEYIKRKICQLYIPYVICNGTFVVLTNIFIKLNIYTNHPEFLTLTENALYKQQTMEPIGILHMGKSLINVCLFRGTTQLGSATWFLGALFLVLMVHNFIHVLLLKMKLQKQEVFIYGGIFVICIGLAVIVPVRFRFFPGEVRRFFCTYAAFLMGYFLKKVNWKYLYSWISGLVAFIALIVMNNFETIELSAAQIGNPILYICCSVCGWIMLMTILRFIARYLPTLRNVTTYIGRHTMSILCLHLIAFKIISLLYIFLNDKPLYLLASFHIIFEVSEGYKILYTIVGVALPILLCVIYEKLFCKRFLQEVE